MHPRAAPVDKSKLRTTFLQPLLPSGDTIFENLCGAIIGARAVDYNVDICRIDERYICGRLSDGANDGELDGFCGAASEAIDAMITGSYFLGARWRVQSEGAQQGSTEGT